jgi:hypothetical protein
MVEFLPARFQDPPMSSYGSCASPVGGGNASRYLPHDLAAPVRWMVNALAPMVENGGIGDRLELN